ncbi:MAG: hypothetical protein PHF37_00870 [Phycisphaerae bacterium]|nr:hypothetical protein [Phycisphaerae bacterium]
MHPTLTLHNWTHHLAEVFQRFETKMGQLVRDWRFWFFVGLAVLYISLLVMAILWGRNTPPEGARPVEPIYLYGPMYPGY